VRGEEKTMELETIVLDREQAKEKWQEAMVAEKAEKKAGVRKYLGEMRRAYYYLKKGNKVLDFFETVKATGLNADGDPKLAIVAIDASKCHFQKTNPGGGTYSRPSNGWRDRGFQSGFNAIHLPANTFVDWPYRDTVNKWDMLRKDIESPTPIIPPKYQNKGEHLIVMWEVEHWQPVGEKGPRLLRRISRNLFVIYGHWNTTKLERAIIRGRL